VSRFLIVLDPDATDAQRDDAVAAVGSGGGEVVALLAPVAVIAEGDASVQSALAGLRGNGVLAVDDNGVLDPSSLNLGDDLTLLVGAWTGTFSVDVQAALSDRFRDGDEWGFLFACDDQQGGTGNE
jgi:hypothetical protein